MNKSELHSLKQEAIKIRRKLDKATNQQERERALRTYAKLLKEIVRKG